MWQYNYDPYLEHKLGFKYIDKYKSKLGNWIYVYKDKAKKSFNNFKNNVKKNISTTAKKVGNATIDTANKVVKKAEKTYDDVFKENPYSINLLMSPNQKKAKKTKLAQQSAEWADIVKRKDPEYTSYNKNTGEYEYDLDRFINDKKHPGLDAVLDVYEGRDIKLRNIELPAMLAGAEDYFWWGVAYLGLRAEVVRFGMETRQGKYNDTKAGKFVQDLARGDIESVMKSEYVQDTINSAVDKAVTTTIKKMEDGSVQKAEDMVKKELKKQYEELSDEVEKEYDKQKDHLSSYKR